MKSLLLTLSVLFCMLLAKAQSAFVQFSTNKGNITVVLFDETPKHRDLFLQNIKKGLFDKAQFNRVIKAFVIQGGELDDTILNREKLHPGIPLQRIPAEISPALFHKKGALGMGRNDNPEKSSYISQIYLVEGKIQTDAQLDAIEQKKGIKYTPQQRETYKTIGGIPRLDQDYTVFGEIVEGLSVAEAINAVSTNKDDVPLTPVIFTPVILSKKQAMKYWKKIKAKQVINKS